MVAASEVASSGADGRGRLVRTPFRVGLLHPRAPLCALGIVSILSLALRAGNLDKPLKAGKQTPALIFDEQYYVNAARVVLGIHPPRGDDYARAALFHDPNAEHPGLAKLLIAGTIRLFGDNPLGWRIAPIIFGSLAIIALYWLIRTAGGGPWLAVGAAILMAADNLMLIHGRIATLDIFLVTLMLVAVALYLRRQFLLSSVALGLGLATKLLAIDVIFVLALFELGQIARGEQGAVRHWRALLRSRMVPLLTVTGLGLAIYLGVLFVLDLILAPIGGPGTCPTTASGFHNPIRHTAFMLCYAGKLTSPNGPRGIASYPWQWLLNEKVIDYYTLTTRTTVGGKEVASHVIVKFIGEMNPAIILLLFPALAVALYGWWSRRDSCSLLTVAWFLGTFVPFVIAAAPLGLYGRRTSYLYYMVVVLPAVYLGVAGLFSRRGFPRAALIGYAAIVGGWFVTLYPIRTWR